MSGRVQGVGFRAATRAKAAGVRRRRLGAQPRRRQRRGRVRGRRRGRRRAGRVLPQRPAARDDRARGRAGRSQRGAGALRAPGRETPARHARAPTRSCGPDSPRGSHAPARASAPPIKRPPPCADGMRMGDPANAMLFFPPLPPVQLRPQASCVIGRSRSCNLRLPSADASRRHAEILAGRDGYVLRDLRQHERHLRERRADPGADAAARRPHRDRRRRHHVLPGGGARSSAPSRRSGRRRRS